MIVGWMHTFVIKDLHGEVIPVVEHATSDYRWAKYASSSYRNSYAICGNIAKRSLMHYILQPSILPLNLVTDYILGVAMTQNCKYIPSIYIL